jgi:hypothetical protein
MGDSTSMKKRSIAFIWCSLGIFGQFFSSGVANATEKLPLNALACDAQALVGYGYESPKTSSGNHNAKLELIFWPTYGSDAGLIRVYTPIKGLTWDQNYKHVIFTAANGKVTTCAKRSWIGISTDGKACYPWGHITLDNTGDQSRTCRGTLGAIFSGEFIVVN